MATNRHCWLNEDAQDVLRTTAVFLIPMALTAIGLTTDLAGLRRTDIRPVVFDEAQWDEISRKPK
ncbi:MAG TPA: hypothetical protein PKK40_01165 [Marmoricola sp.]|nr:hypothetical protein [Marmoricola sp.]